MYEILNEEGVMQGTSYEQGRQWAEETIFNSFNGGGTSSRTTEPAQEVRSNSGRLGVACQWCLWDKQAGQAPVLFLCTYLYICTCIYTFVHA